MERSMINEVRLLNLMQINTLTRTFHASYREAFRAPFHVREAFHVRDAFRASFRVRACGPRILLQATSQALPLLLSLLFPLSLLCSPQPSSSVGGVSSSPPPSFLQAWLQAWREAQQQAWREAWQRALLPLQPWRELKRELVQQLEWWQVQVRQRQRAQQQLVLVQRPLRSEDEQRLRAGQRANTRESIEPSSINYREHHHQHVQILFFETTNLSSQIMPKRYVEGSTHSSRCPRRLFSLFSGQERNDRTCISTAKHSYLNKWLCNDCSRSVSRCIPLFLPSASVSHECPNLER